MKFDHFQDTEPDKWRKSDKEWWETRENLKGVYRIRIHNNDYVHLKAMNSVVVPSFLKWEHNTFIFWSETVPVSITNGYTKAGLLFNTFLISISDEIQWYFLGPYCSTTWVMLPPPPTFY